MYAKELFKHEWLRTIRSSISAQSLATKIFWGFYLLMNGVALFALGLFSPLMFEEIFPTLSTLQVLSGLLPFLLLAGLVVRLFLQPLSRIEEDGYRQLPIPRRSIVQYLILSPLANPINYYAFVFLLLPFCIMTGSRNGIVAGATALCTTLLLTITNTLLAPYLKRILGEGIRFYVVVLGFIGLLVAAEASGIAPWIGRLFDFASSLNIWIECLLLVAIITGCYVASQAYFKHHYYPRERSGKSRERYESLNFVRQYGMVGEMIALHMKLLRRSKRIRNAFIFSFVLMFYGLLFYRQDSQPLFSLALIANLVVSTLMLMMSQWTIRWDCAFFDGLMAQAITARTYIRSHYIMLMALNLISFLLTTPYFLMGQEIIFVHLTFLLWNSGVGIFIILLLASFNKGYIDLLQGGAMNQQGTSFHNFLAAVPVILLGPLFLAVLSIFTDRYTAEIIVGSTGLLGLLLHKPLIELCTRVFIRQKYSLAESFRERK
ncbi:DUF5687 family protein [Porphyromonas loveana]|uniref:DUF5687 family protein n=1 Tax=Porphyromonas loveana TaxID=1884669 RepID=UPI0035A19C6F